MLVPSESRGEVEGGRWNGGVGAGGVIRVVLQLAFSGGKCVPLEYTVRTESTQHMRQRGRVTKPKPETEQLLHLHIICVGVDIECSQYSRVNPSSL